MTIKRLAPVMFMLALLVLVPALAPSVSAAQTDSWQVIPMDKDHTVTYTFEAASTLNITIYAPRDVVTGGVRTLVLFSQKQATELSRYSLGS